MGMSSPQETLTVVLIYSDTHARNLKLPAQSLQVTLQACVILASYSQRNSYHAEDKIYPSSNGTTVTINKEVNRLCRQLKGMDGIMKLKSLEKCFREKNGLIQSCRHFRWHQLELENKGHQTISHQLQLASLLWKTFHLNTHMVIVANQLKATFY